jgi:hypothetical protein
MPSIRRWQDAGVPEVCHPLLWGVTRGLSSSQGHTAGSGLAGFLAAAVAVLLCVFGFGLGARAI